ncbi:hypothetical protein Ark11_0875 [Candidatus Ichthyocystis hellenicum]|uniref:Uncharacterized protein n=1 Tax=Candidatus Ichthyocystis hellenicum TaxID=1561003 RepID=A0A0S4M4B4_9BURK|nr:hypothetical protein Ark11_0875 [Candidatus Ichthyocystis hellenicum]
MIHLHVTPAITNNRVLCSFDQKLQDLCIGYGYGLDC